MASFIDDWLDRQIGVDLGSSTVRVSLPPHESILSEPNILVRNTRSDRVVAVGQSAADLQGRTPEHLDFLQPVRSGRIDNPEAAESLLSELFYTHRTTTEAVLGQQFLVAVPTGAVDTDVRTFADVFDRLGARSLQTVPAPLAALVGVGVPVADPLAQMVVDIGSDTNSLGVVSDGSVIQADTEPTAGTDIDAKIASFLESEFSLRISRLQARDIKHELAAVGELEKPEQATTVYGQDTASRLPREVTVTAEDIRGAIQPVVDEITGCVQSFVQSVSADVAADIYTHGLHLVGGSARLPGLAEELEAVVGVSVYEYDQPETAVVSGLGKITDRPDLQQSKPTNNIHAKESG